MMEIHIEDYQKTLEYLVNKRWEGMEFVAFPIGTCIRALEELPAFTELHDAQEYCHDLSTDVDRYDTLSIRSVYRAMLEGLKEKDRLIENNGIVNVSAMTSQYYNRLEQQYLEPIKEKEIIMNQKNLEYLENQLKYAGFGEELNEKMRENIKADKEEFQLNFDTKYGTDNVLAKLNFKRSEQNIDMYFFNSYDLLLKKEGREETLQQNYRVAFGNTFSLKEAYNMLDGRSVFKKHFKKDPEDGNKLSEYTAWSYLDFKNTDERGNFLMSKNFNYDIEKKLDEYPIKNLEYQDSKNRIIQMLQKGNKAYVNLETSQGEKKLYIEAVPKYNSLNFYDEQQKQLRMNFKKKIDEPGISERQAEGNKVEEKNGKEKKNNLKADGEAEPAKAKRGRSRKVG